MQVAIASSSSINAVLIAEWRIRHNVQKRSVPKVDLEHQWHHREDCRLEFGPCGACWPTRQRRIGVRFSVVCADALAAAEGLSVGASCASWAEASETEGPSGACIKGRGIIAEVFGPSPRADSLVCRCQTSAFL
jgi:hypothetical protein